MIFPASAYVSVIYRPTFDCTINSDAMIIESPNLRVLQTVLVEEIFYRSSYGHSDTVLVVRETPKAHI